VVQSSIALLVEVQAGSSIYHIKGRKLGVFKYTVLRICGPLGFLRKLHNKELDNLNLSLITVRKIK
jgi:hypothetical protein